MNDLILLNGHCYINGELQKTDIAVSNNKISEIGDLKNSEAHEVIDLDGQTVIPGAIDTQVHFREPGNEHKETIHTGSKSAALGGITAFFEMPNTSPSTTNRKELQRKLDIAKETSFTNYAFYIGGTRTNCEDIRECIKMDGLCGVKIFLGSSTGDLLLTEEDAIYNLFKEINLPFAIHSEDEAILTKNKNELPEKPNVELHSVWRSAEAALSSTKKITALARRAERKIHVLHISTKEEIDYLIQQKDICSFEITPQHLYLSAPDCYEKWGSLAQMNPPIRSKDHQDRLWEAVINDEVDVIGSDHAPHLLNEKEKPYPQSPSGIPGVQTIFPLMLNAHLEGKISIRQLVNYFCENPVKLFNIQNKGKIEIGKDADFTIFSDKETSLNKSDMGYKCGWTPFHEKKLKGKVEMTIIGGKVVMRDNKIIVSPSEVPTNPLQFGR